MAKIPLTKVQKLPMPDKFQSITIRVTGVADVNGKIIFICEIYGMEEGMYQLTPTEAMHESMTNDLYVRDKCVGGDFEHVKNHIFTIRGIEASFTRKTKSGEVFKPKVYEFHRRDDIERIEFFGSKEELESTRMDILEKNKEVIYSNNKKREEKETILKKGNTN